MHEQQLQSAEISSKDSVGEEKSPTREPLASSPVADIELDFDEFDKLVRRAEQQHQKRTLTTEVPLPPPRDRPEVQTQVELSSLHFITTLQKRTKYNVLAIITSLSPVESPGKQRTARITDPSIAKQIPLTVSLDPGKFNPKIGSAVLLTGLDYDWVGGDNLRKSAGDKSPEKWWVENPWHLSWCNVAGIKSWWADGSG